MNQMVYEIEDVLKKIVPDLIFVHYEEDTHQDHRALAEATITATRYIRNVLFYEGPTTQDFSPTVFVDIKNTMDMKLAAILAHHSQVQKTNIEGLSNLGHRALHSHLSRYPGQGATCGGLCPSAPLHEYSLMRMIPHSRPTLDHEECAAVTAVLRSGQIAQGEEVSRFEGALAALVGVRGAAAVSSGTAALHLALLALDIGEGDEVVIPSFVCTALLNAIRYVRAAPVFADINRETFQY